MIQYRIAEAKDRESILDFINMVFSMLRIPHNFENMLPKAYSKELGKMDIHVLAEEEGKLRGCLGLYVFPLTICGRMLHVGYLGSMSVHPSARGQGIMGELMRRQIARGEELGLDMLVLGGQRQRYQYSGFETVGANYTYSISKANVRHVLTSATDASIQFEIMEPYHVDAALKIYNQQLVAGARTKDNFIACLKSYHKEALAIIEEGHLVGYISCDPNKQFINEIVLSDSISAATVLKAWFVHYPIKSLHIQVAPHDINLNQFLAPICESYSISPNCMLRVLKYENIIAAYFDLKRKISSIECGERIIGLEGKGTYCISITDDNISVAQTDLVADLTLNDRSLCQLLFDINPYTMMAERAVMPSNWLPLPFHIAEPDSF